MFDSDKQVRQGVSKKADFEERRKGVSISLAYLAPTYYLDWHEQILSKKGRHNAEKYYRFLRYLYQREHPNEQRPNLACRFACACRCRKLSFRVSRFKPLVCEEVEPSGPTLGVGDPLLPSPPRCRCCRFRLRFVKPPPLPPLSPSWSRGAEPGDCKSLPVWMEEYKVRW